MQSWRRSAEDTCAELQTTAVSTTIVPPLVEYVPVWPGDTGGATARATSWIIFSLPGLAPLHPTPSTLLPQHPRHRQPSATSPTKFRPLKYAAVLNAAALICRLGAGKEKKNAGCV